MRRPTRKRAGRQAAGLGGRQSPRATPLPQGKAKAGCCGLVNYPGSVFLGIEFDQDVKIERERFHGLADLARGGFVGRIHFDRMSIRPTDIAETRRA